MPHSPRPTRTPRVKRQQQSARLLFALRSAPLAALALLAVLCALTFIARTEAAPDSSLSTHNSSLSSRYSWLGDSSDIYTKILASGSARTARNSVPMIPVVDSVILAWEPNTNAGSEVTINSSTTDANLNTSTLSRGAGLASSALADSYSSTSFTLNGTFANAVANDDYLQFSISPKPGFRTSLSALDANFRRSGTGPNTFQWQYSLDGFASAGVDIGSAISYTGTATNGDAQTQINLTGISALQNVANPSVITIRLYGYGATNTGGTFAIGKLTGNDLAITGSTAATLAPKYRTRQSGNWNDFTTWQVDTGGGFADAVMGQTPTSADDTIAIRDTHTVTVTASVAADQLTVESGGILNVNNSVTLTVDDGTGSDLAINRTSEASYGTVNVANGGLLAGTGTISVTGELGIASTNAADALATNVTATFTLNTGSTVNFNGAAGQGIGARDYYNLTFSNNAKTLASSGTIGIAGAFNPGTNTSHTTNNSTIEFNCTSGVQNVSLFHTYYNLTLNNTAGTTGASGLKVNDTLTVVQGTFSSASDYHNVVISSGGTLSLAGNVTVSGNWTNNGTFTHNGFSVTFDGDAVNQTIGGNNSTVFAALLVNNTGPVNNNIVSLDGSLGATNVSATSLSITNGVFAQGTGGSSASFSTTGSGTVVSVTNGKWQNFGTGNLLLSGNVSNAGTIEFNGNGTACNELATNDISISSTLGARTWSGTGTFSMTDVTVSNQRVPQLPDLPPPVSILVNSSTDAGGNTGWTFVDQCTAGTYTWIGGTLGANTEWHVGTNWNPTRVTPAAGDILIFDGTSTPAPTVTNVPTQTISSLQLKNSVNPVKLNAAALGPHTLTITGNAGLDVETTSRLELVGSTGLTIAVTTGSGSTINGQIALAGGPHRLTGQNAGQIIFSSTGIFTAGTTSPASGFTGNPFGTGTTDSVRFQDGSNAFFNEGSDPFGTSGGVVTFTSASNQEFNTSTAWAAEGRFYGNLNLTGNQTYFDSGASSQVTVGGNLTIANGSTLQMSNSAGGDLNLWKNYTNNGTFTPNGRTVKFQGLGPQIVTKSSGTETFDYLLVGSGAFVGIVSDLSVLAPNGGNSLTFGPTDSLLSVNGQTLTLGGTMPSVPSGQVRGLSTMFLSKLVLVDGGTTGDMGTVPFEALNMSVQNLTVNRTGAGANVGLGAGMTVHGTLTLTSGTLTTGGFGLQLDSSATANRTSGHVIGPLRKDFSGAANFTFMVGTANGYSPVDANVTGNTFLANTNLTVNAVEGQHPNISGTNALQRYWTLTENGNLQADLTFNWRGGAPAAGDVVGTESSYKIFKYTGSFTQFEPSSPVDTVDHKATLNGVSDFSDWTLAEAAAVEEGSIQFAAANTNDTETNSGSHPVNIAVSRTGGSDGAVSVHWATSAGTATAGTDYVEAFGDLNWADGDMADKTFTITVNGDTDYEANETVNITLSAPTGGATIGGTNPATLTITNDDAPLAALVVNTTNDVDDGFCLPNHCSLREAINAANFSTDASTISFNIPLADPGYSAVTGVFTIQPTGTALPEITRQVTIDGATQTAFTGETNVNGPEVVINGSLLSGSPSGLYASSGAANTVIANLVINGFGSTGVVVWANNAQVLNNYIGTNAAGTAAVANASGLGVGASAGVTSGYLISGNLISGNTGIGLSSCDVLNSTFTNNKIGTDRTGASNVGNSGIGFRPVCGNFANNTISSNIIAYNGGDGFRDEPDYGGGGFNNHQNIRITQNSFFENGALGINLSPPPNGTFDGVTPNDAGDADPGGNNLQNFPVLTVATAGSTAVAGTLNTTPSTSGYVIEIFSNDACDASGNGEGKTYLGSVTTGSTDGSGNVSFTVTVPTLTLGQILTATATDSNGNTSEFSLCFTVTAAPTVSIGDVTLAEGSSGGTTNFSFLVTLSVQSASNVDVTYSTADGTATGGSDYVTVLNGNLSIPAGQTSGHIVITVNHDTVYEANETFFVNITNATNATINDGQGLGTINNDDPQLTSIVITNTAELAVSTTEGNSFRVAWSVLPEDTGTPTGTVTVTVDGGPGCSGPVEAGQCYVDNPTPGTKSLVASYGGDSNFLPSTSDAVSHTVTTAVCTTPPAGLVGWWPGDGNAHDIQGPTFENGTLQNGATFATGKVNPAFSFDGSDDEVVIPHNAAQNSAQITIDAWINQTTSGNGRSILNKRTAGNVGGFTLETLHGVAGINNGIALCVWVGGTLTCSLTPSDVITNGTWHHVAGTYDGSNMRIFVDGIQQALTPLTGPIDPSSEPMKIGRNIATPTFTFHGMIDEVELFNTALSSTDIANIYNATFAGKCRECTTPPTNMVSWWDGSGSAPTANDIADGNSGTLQGGATFAPGKVGQGFNFTSPGDGILVPHNANQNTGTQLTVDAWINPANVSTGDASIINKRTAANAQGYTLELTNTGSGLDFEVTTSGGLFTATAANVLTANVWQHVAATYDGTTIRIYLNGIEVSTAPANGVIDSVTSDLVIGRNIVTGATFPGLIDEVELFSRALPASEIAAIANSGNAGKCHTSAVTVGVDPASVTEDGAGNLVYTFSRSGDITTAVTVNFTVGGTATFGSNPGDDYTQTGATTFNSPAGQGTIEFLANEGTKTITIDPTLDTTVEPDETVVLTVTSGTGYEVAGPAATGTISNDDATLTLVKTVINNNGGNKVVSDFPLFIDGNPVTSGTAITVSANAVHTASETTQTGYAPSAWGTDCNADGTITLQPGDNKTCTITNDDVAPTLTLVKTVINDSGGSKVFSDFPLFINGNPVTSGTPMTVSANAVHTATETTQTGYAPSAWGTDCNADGTITLQPGDNKTCTITNDDVVPTISIDDVSHAEGDTGTVDYDFTVSLSYSSTQTITVNYATANDTAVAPGDYTAVTTTQLQFNPGETSKLVKVVANTDTVYELDEDFVVNLSSPVNATIGDGEGRGTITDDDPQPNLSIGNVTKFEGTTVGTTTSFDFTVTKSGNATEVNATVNYATAPGTASENPTAACSGTFDYQFKTGSLTFTPLEFTKTITILVCKDSTFEADETFFVNLTGETHVTVTDNQGLGTIANDDAAPPLSPVNTTNDTDDGTCDASHCSLREAINAANASSGSVSIIFAIPANDPRHFYYVDDNLGSPGTPNGTVTLANVMQTASADDTPGTGIPDIDPDWPHSWWSILPASALPALNTTAVGATIDGYSQTEASADTASAGHNAILRIEINGSGILAGVTHGLTIGNGSNTVTGLIINRFLGTGGPGTGNGVAMTSSSDALKGNFIGTDPSGTIDVGNAGSGVVATISNVNIGGSSVGDANLISGNDGHGIAITGNSVVVQGNYIGTKADGTSALGNALNGVALSGGGAVFNTIGGTGAGESNLIAFSGQDGVTVGGGFSNSIRGNSIFSNGTTILHLGIDLDADGVTDNDPLDPDSGPNNLQNFPIIRAALADTLNRIRGTLNSEANKTYTIDLYANTACDTSGNGEGKTYLGSTTADTGANGDALWSLNPATLNAGDFITATATDATGNTSEFSACFQATALNAGTVQFVSAPYTESETNADHAVIITVSRTGGSNLAVDVTYATSDGTATAGEDYVAASGTLHWNNGETGDKTFTITVKGDTVFERDETVNITLSNPTNGATISGTNPTTLTITNDDPCPTTFTVNSNGDDGDALPSDGVCATAGAVCTLRAAIEEANALTSCGTIDINFSVTGVINLANALPAINHNVNINGPGANLLTVQRSMAGGTPNFRVFTVNNGVTASIEGSTISNGRVTDPDNGGGVLNNGTLTMTNCNFYGNSATSGVLISGGLGGGLYNAGSLVLTNCNIGGLSAGQGNTATTVGGGLHQESGTLVMNGGSITGNSLGGVALRGTSAIFKDVRITENTSGSAGGAGVAVLGATTNLLNCLIANNSSSTGGGAGLFMNGGNVTVVNSTISGNSTTFGSGGGVYVGLQTLNLINVTITNNRAGQGGGLFKTGGTTVTLKDTIVAGNFQGASPSTTGDDFRGVGGIDSLSSFNLIGTCTDCGLSNGTNNNQVGVANAMLASLGNNGGPTQTHLLLPGSPAINAASNANLPADTFDLDGDSDTSEQLPVDQRGIGFPRIVNTTVDIGAVEVDYAISTTAGSGQSAQINTAFGTQLKATVTESGNPVSGIPVTFTGPVSGARATFSPGATVNTDANGVATVTATANGTANDPQNVPYTVTASLAGGSPSTNFALTNLKGSQTITVNTHAPANAAFNSNFTVAATASSGLAVTYSSSGSCTNVGSMFTMISGAGVCTVKYDQAGDSNYNQAPQVTETVNAQKANQTITVDTHAPANAAFNSNFTVAATASSGLAITYSSSGSCTNVGSMFTMISGAGVCTVTYEQPGNDNYAAAPPVTESVTAQKATATLTLSNLTQFYDGTAKFVTASTTPAGLNLTITYSQSGSPVAAPTDYGAYAVSATIDDPNYQGGADGTLAIVPRLYVDINNRVIAIDSVTFAAEPFSIGGEHNFSTDNLTRIMIFTSNLGATSAPSGLSVQVGAIPLTIEGVGALPGTPDISYIIVKLENQPGLIGDVMLSVTYRDVTSNLGVLTISP
jgi:CSLREA domain-containing protein